MNFKFGLIIRPPNWPAIWPQKTVRTQLFVRISQLIVKHVLKISNFSTNEYFFAQPIVSKSVQYLKDNLIHKIFESSSLLSD
ncbi:hypothetical protein BpHYR1_022103 [Brachionus plicatilis]|uniref:Uncharacterized protein n=1 Tax=Brachionus plicatilis TaxID=10195 RepID=A0A3M7PSS3_BRAPC|nr:hypothetical protein BpHYR1_022103 [Brachionus plicatilis]